MNSPSASIRSTHGGTRKSCEHCRGSKLKCSRTLPCDRCVKRGHPELCFYSERNKKGAVNSGSSGNHASPSEATRAARLGSRTSNVDPLAPVGTGLGTARGTHHMEDQATRQPYLGANSLPRFLDGEPSARMPARTMASQGVRDAVMPMLGATTFSCSPLYTPSKDGERQIVARLCLSLPLNRDIIKLFRVYQMDVHPFVPIMSSLPEFEADLCEYVQKHNSACCRTSLTSQDHVHCLLRGQSMAWVSILFGLLACGTQFCGYSASERQKKCSIYATCALESLQLVDYLFQPTFLCVQSMLLIGYVMQNDMRPQAAWTFLGMTIRAAQGLGFHAISEHSSPERSLWLALVRQDSLLALCFDRVASFPQDAVRLDLSASGRLSYQSAMDHLADLSLRTGRIAAEPSPHSFALRRDFAADVETIRCRAMQTRGDTSKPLEIQERCEMYHLDLHLAFVKAWVCRPSLGKPSLPDPIEEIRNQLVATCLQSLRDCLDAFVGLQTLSSYACRSWSVIHNGLSSALVLALTGEANNDGHLRQTFKNLLDMFQEHQPASGDQELNSSENLNLSAPYTRAVKVLQKICMPDNLQAVSEPDHQTLENTMRSGPPATVDRDGAMQYNENQSIPERLDAGDRELDFSLDASNFSAGAPSLDLLDSIWPFDMLAGTDLDDLPGFL